MGFHMHRHMHAAAPRHPTWPAVCLCVHTHHRLPHTHPCQLTVLLAAANSSHCRLSWAWHFKASMMEPQQTAPATPPQASLDTPGLTTGGEPFHRCLCVCGGVRHSGGAPGQMLRSPLYRHLLSEPERVCTIPFLLRPCPGQHQTLTCPELVLSAGEGGRGVWQGGHSLEEAALSTCTCRVFTPVAFGPYRRPSPPFLSPFTEKERVPPGTHFLSHWACLTFCGVAWLFSQGQGQIPVACLPWARQEPGAGQGRAGRASLSFLLTTNVGSSCYIQPRSSLVPPALGSFCELDTWCPHTAWGRGGPRVLIAQMGKVRLGEFKRLAKDLTGRKVAEAGIDPGSGHPLGWLTLYT